MSCRLGPYALQTVGFCPVATLSIRAFSASPVWVCRTCRTKPRDSVAVRETRVRTSGCRLCRPPRELGLHGRVELPKTLCSTTCVLVCKRLIAAATRTGPGSVQFAAMLIGRSDERRPARCGIRQHTNAGAKMSIQVTHFNVCGGPLRSSFLQWPLEIIPFFARPKILCACTSLSLNAIFCIAISTRPAFRQWSFYSLFRRSRMHS